ncbi:sugar ABC transporter permease [Paenibacillus alginolyticus]|uniref:Sugar ABC transporter permease n=1 Tax=Paenibacillus alginolyticus TaxID=59839 RepID=A0ABT4G5F0_9BACL|nr:sugar ABC transporter permease [Paenibacillus alginolyticus]MCY9668798.1 sugar ABC transporter permease [Paenibacillus alginolyticus]MCY9691399.1 sugar ABC transporter permease [Paenibacillus alginolyticus]MEC0146507.1 sugar ABC transporter permease [Paenibacillus alginolyticus]
MQNVSTKFHTSTKSKVTSIGLQKRRESITGYSFIIPAVLLLIVFLLLPFLLAVVFGFTKFNLLRPDQIKFTGLDNYVILFKDKLFYKSLYNTMYFTVVVVPVQSAVALLLALLVNNQLKLRNVFRIAYFSPVITSMTVIAILWISLYNPNEGLINSALHLFGIPKQPFLRSADQAMNSIIFMSVWQAAGYQMMIFLAGLQSIPKDLYEASAMDGANKFQQLKYITIPSLYNVIVFVLTITTIQAVKLFTQPYVMTNGGPENSTRTLALLIYQQGFQFRNAGYASAVSVIFFLIVVVISFSMKKFFRDR